MLLQNLAWLSFRQTCASCQQGLIFFFFPRQRKWHWCGTIPQAGGWHLSEPTLWCSCLVPGLPREDEIPIQWVQSSASPHRSPRAEPIWTSLQDGAPMVGQPEWEGSPAHWITARHLPTNTTDMQLKVPKIHQNDSVNIQGILNIVINKPYTWISVIVLICRKDTMLIS